MENALTQALAGARLKRVEGDEVNRAPQYLLQGHFETSQREERRIGIRLNQQVNVACRSLLATSE